MAGPVKLSQGKIVQASEFHILYRICSLGIWGEWNDFQDSSLTDLSTLQSALTAATNAATAAQTAALSAQTLASNASTSVSSLSTQVQTLNDTVKELSEGSSGNIYPFDLWVEKEETIDEVEAETGEIAWVVDGMLFLEKYDSGWRSSTSTSVDYNVLRDSGEALFQMGNSLYRFNGKKLLRLTDESDLENLAAAEESENTSQAAAGIYPFDLWVEQEESLLTLESSKEGDIAWVVDGKMFLQRATSVSAWHTKTVYNELRDTALFSCGQNLYRYDGSKMVRLVDENDLSSLQSGASSSSSSTGSSSEELIRYYRRAIDLMPGENLICDGNFWFAGNNLGSSVYSALGLKYWAGGGLNSNTVTANSRFGYVSDVPYDSLIANDEEKILYKGMSYALSFYCWGSCSALEVLASTQTLLSKGEIADTGEATAEATADAAYVSLSFTAEANSSLIFHNPDNQKIFIAQVKLCVRSSPTLSELEKRLSSIEQALTSSGISFEQIGE